MTDKDCKVDYTSVPVGPFELLDSAKKRAEEVAEEVRSEGLIVSVRNELSEIIDTAVEGANQAPHCAMGEETSLKR